jgi:3-phenylpropionate/trans-cinnamate dioxygenase ferredoxin reductase subunit
MKDYGMVIVGAGEAGARAAVELRTQGWSGPITLIGDEKEHPYERPPLSKQQLYADEQPIPVTILDHARMEEYAIHFLSGDPVVRIDRQGHFIELASGNQVPYERLLLATGANPRKMTVNGTGAEEILYLRRFADALHIRERLQPGKRVAIIGGGFIGLEVAASAIAKGCQVALIEVAPRILMRGVPEEIAAIVEAHHRAAGVAVTAGVMIDSINRYNDELAIALADGTEIRCDAIVAGIGAVPEVTLAANCELEIENGIKVNEFLVTSDPDIYAAGDCCSFPHPLYGGQRIRLEAWRNAQDQGTHAAGNMLGASAPYVVVPWFWSDQYDQTLYVAGLSGSAKTTVLRDLGEAGKLFFHLEENGRIVSVSSIGPSGTMAKEIRLAELLIENGSRPDPLALADPGRRLKELLRS